MNLFVYRKLNLVVNVLIVVICILMLVFLKTDFFKKIIIATILILKLFSILDHFKNKKVENKSRNEK
ncbi:hypothetical protein HMPREF9127_0570 [Parvimonas sp. oral taxon 393 str. F0440]|nr:hypothetical protein HMPREF9127_0570 [Parvimonas sp. oral taxon 393 str. F0440]